MDEKYKPTPLEYADVDLKIQRLTNKDSTAIQALVMQVNNSDKRIRAVHIRLTNTTETINVQVTYCADTKIEIARYIPDVIFELEDTLGLYVQSYTVKAKQNNTTNEKGIEVC